MVVVEVAPPENALKAVARNRGKIRSNPPPLPRSPPAVDESLKWKTFLIMFSPHFDRGGSSQSLWSFFSPQGGWSGCFLVNHLSPVVRQVTLPSVTNRRMVLVKDKQHLHNRNQRKFFWRSLGAQWRFCVRRLSTNICGIFQSWIVKLTSEQNICRFFGHFYGNFVQFIVIIQIDLNDNFWLWWKYVHRSLGPNLGAVPNLLLDKAFSDDDFFKLKL